MSDVVVLRSQQQRAAQPDALGRPRLARPAPPTRGAPAARAGRRHPPRAGPRSRSSGRCVRTTSASGTRWIIASISAEWARYAGRCSRRYAFAPSVESFVSAPPCRTYRRLVRRMARVHRRRHHREEEAVRGLQVVARAGHSRGPGRRARSCAEYCRRAGSAQARRPGSGPGDWLAILMPAWIRAASPASPPNKFRPTRRHWLLAIGGVAAPRCPVPVAAMAHHFEPGTAGGSPGRNDAVCRTVSTCCRSARCDLRLLSGVDFLRLRLRHDGHRAEGRVSPTGRVLRLGARHCQLSGVDVWRLIRKQGLYGSLFRCSTCALAPTWRRPTSSPPTRRSRSARISTSSSCSGN